MDIETLTVIVLGVILFAIVSKRLEGTIFTLPLVFVVFGVIISSDVVGFAHVDVDHGVIHTIAELTLILVLFYDASRIDLGRLRRDHNLPKRSLLVALPLIIASGTFVALWLFPGVSVWEAALLAAILAPTDAALGQTVVSHPSVPVRIRQALNVESGLNDGIALPAVLMFAALSIMPTDTEMFTGEWFWFGLKQITLGPIAGVAIGFVGAKLIDFATNKEWMTTSFEGICVLALAVLAFLGAEMIGGNGFISAFVAGLVFGQVLRSPCIILFEFMESQGQLFMLITFLIFGTTLLPEAAHHLTGAVVLYAVLSLTAIRMIPIALSLLGTGLAPWSYLFIGWFGPRGLASILFALLILEREEVIHGSEILTITTVTVALSVLLHAITAAPFARLYGAYVSRLGECEEAKSVSEMPTRSGTADSAVNFDAK
jgi:NhaP-type Na+/H+ or K+/H+ antiporter